MSDEKRTAGSGENAGDVAREAADACFCLRARQAARLVTRRYDDALRPVGLRITQFTMLAAVTAAGGSLSFSALAERLGMDRTTFSRNVAPLRRRGLVVLRDDLPGRARSVALTAEGAALFARAAPLWRQAQTELRDLLGDTDWQALGQGLARAGARMSEAMDPA
ncbi:MarR family winged helix-turn-helix transcriptional regulator [Marinibaculum pumilum]|uniref:MarR family winged helix-turn-helix transcriptional regulator n=1 Tax=Marinibaculum pumilum TaxID=1766165 RepID=A0ABV7L4B4_9PROT